MNREMISQLAKDPGSTALMIGFAAIRRTLEHVPGVNMSTLTHEIDSIVQEFFDGNVSEECMMLMSPLCICGVHFRKPSYQSNHLKRASVTKLVAQ